MKIQHDDHGIAAVHAAFLADALAGENGFFVKSFKLPDALPSLPCGLWGPSEGDEPVLDGETRQAVRGPRGNMSRMVDRGTRPGRYVIAIGDASRGVLYTAYGSLTGSIAPREPATIDASAEPEAYAESTAFWAVHALAALP